MVRYLTLLLIVSALARGSSRDAQVAEGLLPKSVAKNDLEDAIEVFLIPQQLYSYPK